MFKTGVRTWYLKRTLPQLEDSEIIGLFKKDEKSIKVLNICPYTVEVECKQEKFD